MVLKNLPNSNRITWDQQSMDDERKGVEGVEVEGFMYQVEGFEDKMCMKHGMLILHGVWYEYILKIFCEVWKSRHVNVMVFFCFRFFNDRFKDGKGAASEDKFSYIPFGAGRHRCIGESFAYVQIKAVWSTLLRMYEFDLVDGHFPEVDVTTMIHTPKNPVIRYRKRLLTN